MTCGEHSQTTYLRITLRRSVIGHPRSQKQTARALGLTRLGRTVVRPDNPAVRGMIRAIQHLVSVEEIEQPARKRAARKSQAPRAQQEEAT